MFVQRTLMILSGGNQPDAGQGQGAAVPVVHVVDGDLGPVGADGHHLGPVPHVITEPGQARRAHLGRIQGKSFPVCDNSWMSLMTAARAALVSHRLT